MFDQYQDQACATFKEHTTIEPEKARLLDWGLGLGGETGEVHELLKHHIFHDAPLDKMELAKEMGDVLWYLAAIATTTGIRLNDIAALNNAKLSHRYDNAGFDKTKSAERHSKERNFKDTNIYKVLRARITHDKAPMNVIFVGPDGSGKTTIAKKVAEAMGFKYHKCDYRQDDKPQLALHLLEEQIDVIYDRFYWPDDVIYCSAKGITQPEEYWNTYNEVVKKLCTYNTLFIYVTASQETLKERSKQWADDYIAVEHLQQIDGLYQNWFAYLEQLRIATFKLDTTGITPDTAEFDGAVEACVKAIEAGQDVYANNID